jgi:dipeptidyl aminopeptidase/acylaminoacyl peptidase
MREKASFTGRGEIFVRPVDASSHAGPWQITDNDNASSAYWRRDGKEIYHMGLDRSVMVLDVKTAGAFTFGKPKLLFRPAGVVPDRIATISRDGQRFLALTPAKGHKLQQITIFDRKGKAAQKIGDPGLYQELAFSDDGKRLAVVKNDISTGLDNIWVIDIATGKGTQLTNDVLFKVNPIWTHDGRYVIYSVLRRPNMGIFRRVADASAPEELLYEYTLGAFIRATDISRDGKLLIAESGGVVLAVPLTGPDAKGREAIEYLRTEFDCGMARLSPDGKLMAFESDEVQPERNEVYVRPFDVSKPARDGDTKWQISKSGANSMLSWRGDGREIFFGGLNLENNDLFVMAADVSTSPAFHAGAPKMLFKIPGPVGTGSFVDAGLANVSRDGQRFVFGINVPAEPEQKADAR